MLSRRSIDALPHDFLAAEASIFAVFDERTQDSGNVSYGVEALGARLFVKTAGNPEDPRPYLSHDQRVAALRNAVRLADDVRHPTLPELRGVIESPTGPMLVYDWVEGDLARSNLERVRALHPGRVSILLRQIYDLHRRLVCRGWVACDFYDGAIIYNFRSHEVHAVDLDSYHQGTFINNMGMMFGSTRFMAPEEFELGATIDERTTVFTMGRTAAVLLSDGSLERDRFRGSASQYDAVVRACEMIPERRFQTMDELCAAWIDATRTRLGC